MAQAGRPIKPPVYILIHVLLKEQSLREVIYLPNINKKSNADA